MNEVKKCEEMERILGELYFHTYFHLICGFIKVHFARESIVEVSARAFLVFPSVALF